MRLLCVCFVGHRSVEGNALFCGYGCIIYLYLSTVCVVKNLIKMVSRALMPAIANYVPKCQVIRFYIIHFLFSNE